jgi:hypothetical protein
MNARRLLVVVSVFRDHGSAFRVCHTDPCFMTPDSCFPITKGPGLRPGLRIPECQMDLLEVHSATTSKSAAADFDHFKSGGLVNGFR